MWTSYKSVIIAELRIGMHKYHYLCSENVSYTGMSTFEGWIEVDEDNKVLGYA